MREKLLKMTRAIIVMVVTLLSLTLPSQLLAYDFVVDGIYYDITSENTCAVTYESFNFETYQTENPYSDIVVIPEKVNYNGADYSVTSIGDRAFQDCSGLTEVTIPNSVTEIGYYAFKGCSGLTEVTIPNSITSIGRSEFFGCSGLTQVTIPNSVTSIGYFAFCGCTGLTEVTIPNSVTSIGRDAFSSCTGLTSVTIPNSVTSIGDYAFDGCSGLTSVTIPNSVTSIGYYAFCDCSGLTEVTIPNSVTSIGNYAFYGCTGVKEVIIGDSVTSIGRCAFEKCSNLTSVTIGNSVTEIKNKAFYNCTNIANLNIKDSETDLTIGDYAFTGVCPKTVYLDRNINTIFWNNEKLENLTIGNSVTYIKEFAFRDCTSLTSVTIGNSVTSIGIYAFYKCNGLTEVIIPNSVTTIGAGAFKDCNLTSVVIGNSVTEIDIDAFNSNYNLKFIECLAVEPPKICLSSFYNYNVPLFVPNENYKSADIWSNFTNITCPYNPSSMTFEVDGLCYEVSSAKTCCLYAISKNLIGDELVIPETVEYSGRQLTPNELKSGTIYGLEGIKSIKIPSCITTLESGAILNSQIEKIFLARSITTNFLLWSKVNELVISSDVSNISVSLKTNNINKITIEDSNNSLTTTNLECKPNEIYMGRNVSSSAFKDMTSLETVTISDSVTKIDQSTFHGCTGLTRVEISDLAAWCGISFLSGYETNPLYYAHHLYLNGKEITDLVIPDSVTSIGGDAFYSCTGLTSVTIPNSVTSIGWDAFWGCSGLTRVEISDLTAWCGINFSVSNSNPLARAHHLYLNSKEITDLVIPDSVTSISNYAFYGCTGVKEVTIPNSVTSIGYSAFSDCNGLTSLTFEDGAKSLSLGSNAITSTSLKEAYFGRQMSFSYISCPALETVEFGENVTSIAGSAFKNSTAIRTVKSHNVTPPTTDDAFASETYMQGTLYVPSESISDYQNATGWENFWTIESIDEVNGVNDVYTDDNTTFSVSNGALHVVGDTPVRVVAINGTVVYSGRGNKDINLNKGMYIVVIGNKASKIVVK